MMLSSSSERIVIERFGVRWVPESQVTALRVEVEMLRDLRERTWAERDRYREALAAIDLRGAGMYDPSEDALVLLRVAREALEGEGRC
jgi:hypothetical protein